MKVETERQMTYVRHNFIQVKNKLLNKYSPTESHFEKLLQDAHIYYYREKCNFRYNTRWSYFDYYLPYQKIYIELDGKSHDTDEQKLIDKEKEDVIKRRQAYLLRIKNEDVLNMESISIEKIKDMLFDYLGRKSKSHGRLHYERRYNEVMQQEYNDAIAKMSDVLVEGINPMTAVCLYQKDMDSYFAFENLFVAKMSTKLSINEIAKMLLEECKYSPNRKYVFATTFDECKNNVSKVYCKH